MLKQLSSWHSLSHTNQQGDFKQIWSLLGLCVLMLAMIKSAHAAVEQVAPLSGGNQYIYYGPNPSTYPQYIRSDPGSAYRAATNTTLPLIIQDMGSASTSYLYLHNYVVSTSQSFSSLWIVPIIPPAKAVCPATTPPYTFNPNTNYCERPICPPGTQLNAAGTACVETFTLRLNVARGDIAAPTTKPISLQVANIAIPPVPKAGAVVRVVLGAQPNANGTAAPLAKLTGCAAVSTVPGGYDCTTDAKGFANFSFVPPAVAGSHTLTATCTTPVCVNTGSTTINVITCPAGQTAHPVSGCMLDCSTQPGTYPNQDDTACVADSAPNCSIKPIKPLPIAATDACTAALEADQPQAYRDQMSVCGPIDPAMDKEKACLIEKMASKGITMQSTAEVRSMAYQAHFRDIWDKMESVMVKEIQKDPVMKAACAPRVDELAKEKGCDHAGACVKKDTNVSDCYLQTSSVRSHCFNAAPAPATSSAKHAQGMAMDVKAINVKTLQTILRGPPPMTVPQFLRMPSPANPTVCPAAPQLMWGGDWPTNPDKVHFYLP